MNRLGVMIKERREEADIPLRKVAAFLDIDQAILSKIERGHRKPKREQVEKLAEFFDLNKEELLVTWLSDKVLYEVRDEELAMKALQLAEEQVAYGAQKKSDRGQMIDKLRESLRQFPKVEKAWLFGSFVRMEETPGSDVDILIDVRQDMTFTLFDIAEIQEQLQKDVEKHVDVVMLNGVRQSVKSKIQDEMQLIYEAG